MKKHIKRHIGIIGILALSALSLSSCLVAYDPPAAYFHAISESGFRYIQIRKSHDYYVIDEFHYKETVYNDNGDVVIDIDVPTSINGVEVAQIGGVYKIDDEGDDVKHNFPSDHAGNIYFEIIIYDYYEAGTSFLINFHIPKSIVEIGEIYDCGMLYYTPDPYCYVPCKVKKTFEVEEGNEHYRSEDGKLINNYTDEEVRWSASSISWYYDDARFSFLHPNL